MISIACKINHNKVKNFQKTKINRKILFPTLPIKIVLSHFSRIYPNINLLEFIGNKRWLKTIFDQNDSLKICSTHYEEILSNIKIKKMIAMSLFYYHVDSKILLY